MLHCQCRHIIFVYVAYEAVSSLSQENAQKEHKKIKTFKCYTCLLITLNCQLYVLQLATCCIVAARLSMQMAISRTSFHTALPAQNKSANLFMLICFSFFTFISHLVKKKKNHAVFGGSALKTSVAKTV